MERAAGARRRSRRQRAFRRWWHRWGLLVAIGTVAALLLWAVLPGRKEEVLEAETMPPAAVKTEASSAPTKPMDPENFQWPFNTMSADWGGEDLEGFTLYEIPADYKRTGGTLPEVVQVYTYCLCRDYEVDFCTVLAVIEVESGYQWQASSGTAVGYMQISPKWHQERMERLGFADVMNPYWNIKTGIDYLAELLGRYDGNYSKALTAYCWGPSGAYDTFFRKGVEGSEYSQEVQERAEQIRKQLGGGGA